MPTPDIYGLTHRESLGYWLNQAHLVGSGVEVGCAFGQFASRVLSQWTGQRYFMVDPWENLPKEEYPEDHEHVDYEDWFKCCSKLAEDDKRVTLLRKRSLEAVSEFKTASLDWVYLDGNHDYRFVMEDLDAWFPKIIRGGLICGHDFYNTKEGGHWCAVADAVLRWMKEHNTVFTVTPCTSWWAIKL